MATKSILNEKLKQEQRKSEDKTYYSMIISIIVAMIIEFSLIALYRSYFAGENYRPTLRIVQWAFLCITAISGVTFIYSVITKKFIYLKSLFAIGATFFGCAVILRLTNTLGIVALRTSCTVVPIILLLYIIYLIYQVEFLMSAIFGSLGIFTMWFTTKVFYIRYFMRLYVMGGVALLLIILAVLTFIAMKNKGYIGKGDWKFRLFAPRTSYKALFLTYGVTLGLFAIYLLTEVLLYPVSMPFIIAFAGFIFISAIYHTIKLM